MYKICFHSFFVIYFLTYLLHLSLYFNIPRPQKFVIYVFFFYFSFLNIESRIRLYYILCRVICMYGSIARNRRTSKLSQQLLKAYFLSRTWEQVLKFNGTPKKDLSKTNFNAYRPIENVLKWRIRTWIRHRPPSPLRSSRTRGRVWGGWGRRPGHRTRPLQAPLPHNFGMDFCFIF